MDIKGISAAVPPIHAINAQPVTEHLPAKTDNGAVAPVERVRTDGDAGHERHQVMALGANVRLQLYVDEGTNDVYGRVFDRNSGELLREIPSEELRSLRALVRELYGAFIDELA